MRENNNDPCKPPEATGGNGPCYYDKESGTIKYRGNSYAPYYIDADNDGKPDQNGTWGSSFVNSGDPVWKALIKAQIDELVNDAGYDGFFLDTIGTAETVTYGWTSQGMVDLIAEMRQHLDATYGDGKKFMVANAAVSLFDSYQPYVNGVMLESFSSRWFIEDGNVTYKPWDEIDRYNNTRLARMLNTLRCYPYNTSVNVFTLDYCAEDDTDCTSESVCRARSFGLIPGVTNMYLDKIYETIPVSCNQFRGIHLRRDTNQHQQLNATARFRCRGRAASHQFLQARSQRGRGMNARKIVLPVSSHLGHDNQNYAEPSIPLRDS